MRTPYRESEDALRVMVKPRAIPFREWLSYEFTRRLPDEATLEFQWEELAVPVQLQATGKSEEAFRIFRMNCKRFGEVWPTHIGMMGAESGAGNYPAALEHARKALAQAPDPMNRKNLESAVALLEAGKPVK
ncbi:MAG: DUF2911 domain-containing protein [Bryobacteraceae bacterium]